MSENLHKHAYSIEELLQIHPQGRTSIYEAIKAGQLIARKAGRSTIILETDYVDYLASLPRMDRKGEEDVAD